MRLFLVWKGKERKGKERKGKERKGKERKEEKCHLGPHERIFTRKKRKKREKG
jgi:hypothetical protein